VNKDTAREAIHLYTELADIDVSILSLKNHTNPLQKVTFYCWTPFVSGPKDYQPKHNNAAIVACILADLALVRVHLAAELEALGFEVAKC
jgi:hypothetical protein